MIEAGDTTSGGGIAPADEVAGWMRRALQLAAECADDAARIDLLSAFESMKGVCAGGQAQVTVGFVATQTAEGLASGTGPEVIRRSVAGQVALARRDSRHRGGRHVGLAAALHTELPHTRMALEQGRITEWQATLVCRETACLGSDLRRVADERLAPDLGAVGDRMLERHAARVTAELDAAAVAERAGRAARDRRVTVRPAPDTMAYLTALLPASVAIAAYAALTSYTQLVVGEGDVRGRGQIMADTLVDRLTGGAITGCDEHGAPLRRPDPDDQTTDSEDERQAADEQAVDEADDEHAADGQSADEQATAEQAADESEEEQAADEQAADGQAAAGPEDEQQASDEPAGDPAEDGQDGKASGGEEVTGEPVVESEDKQQAAGPEDEQAADGRAGAESDTEQAAADPPGDGTAEPAAADPPAAAPDAPAGQGTDQAPGTNRGRDNPGRYRFPTAADARAKLATALPTAANIHLHVIMTDRTLFGVCEEPAELAGYGPIPAQVARALAAADLGPNATTWLRRFYTDPQTGQLAATESRARRFPQVMREFLLVRDRACRTPFCHAPGRHDDHELDHAHGGPTGLGNGQLTCQSCNHTKQAPGWTVTTGNDGSIETTTPTGHTYHSPPPTPPGVEHHTPPGRADTQLEHRLHGLILEYQAA